MHTAKPGLSENSCIYLLPQRLTHCNLHKGKEAVTDFIPFHSNRQDKRSFFQTLRRKLQKSFLLRNIREFSKGQIVHKRSSSL